MPRYLFILFLLLNLLPDLAAAQIRYRMGSETRPITRFDNSRPSAIQKGQSSILNEDVLQEVTISEGKTCLYNKTRTFLYLGEVSKSKGNQDTFPNGKGIVRYATILPESDSISCEYCFCSWTRGSRHGSGLLKRPDGSIVKAIWKWDRLKSVAPDPPTDEEKAFMESSIEDLNALLTLLGR